MNNFFNQNTAALKSHTDSRDILSPSLPTTITSKTTVKGDITVQYNNILIHSGYDPVKEGKDFAKNIRPGSMVFLYGFGLGYHIEALLNRIGDQGILLTLELNPDILSAAMILKDQTRLLKHPRFKLIFGEKEEGVAPAVVKYMENFNLCPESARKVLFHNPSFQCIPDSFPRIANALEILQIERRFPAVLGGLEETNYRLNREIILRTPGINSLRNTFLGKPGVLISAGPSLDDALPYLQTIRHKILLASVDTTFPILSREGIIPDYVFSLDPQEESFNYFTEGLDLPTRLVFTPTANSRIVHSFRGEKFVVFKENHSPTQGDEATMVEKGTTRSGGSVSCLGLDCLIQFGCEPIILIGQDCAFSGNRSYSGYSQTNEKLMDKIDQKQSLSTSHVEKNRGKKQIRVECADGKEVFTSQVMYSYLRTLEQLAKAHPNTRMYNLCSHGALIENIQTLGSISELITLLENI